MKISLIAITPSYNISHKIKKIFSLSYDKGSVSFPNYYVYLGALSMVVIKHNSSMHKILVGVLVYDSNHEQFFHS